MKGRRGRHEEHENHERWLVSYADFITLLFAFFVVLYATSNADREKQKEFEDSVKASLKIVAVGMGGGQQTAGDANTNIVPELVNPIDGFPRRGGPAEVQDFIERQIKQNFGKDELAKAGIETRRDALGARISLSAAAFFPSGEAKLKKSSLEALDKVAEILKKADRRIVVEGHTDNQAIRSAEFPSNWELASLRATSVVRYLVKYHSLDPGRLSATSYADQKPVAANDNEEDRAKNRRIELLITGEESSQ